MKLQSALPLSLLAACMGLMLLASGCASGPGNAEPADTMHGCSSDMGYPSCAPPPDMQPMYYPEYPDFEDYYYPGSGVVIVPQPVPAKPQPKPPMKPGRPPRAPRPVPCHPVAGHPCP